MADHGDGSTTDLIDRTRSRRPRGAALAASVIAAAAWAATAPVAAAQSVGGGLGGDPVPGPTTAPETGSSGSGTGLIVAVGVGILLLVVVLMVIAVVVGRSRRGADDLGRPPLAGAGPVAAPMTAPMTGPVAGPAGDQAMIGHERERLVQVLIDVGDQLDSVALAAWVTQALGEVGVTEVVADGERFDPARHQALDQVVTPDPAADGLVAQTPKRGFVDRGRIVRLPQVLVYRYQAGS